MPTQHTFCTKNSVTELFFLFVLEKIISKNHLICFGYETALHIFSVTDMTPIINCENKPLVSFHKTTFMRILWLEIKPLVKVMFVLQERLCGSFLFRISHSDEYRAAISLWGHWRSRSWKTAFVPPSVRRSISSSDGMKVTTDGSLISGHFCWIPVSTIFSSQSLMTICQLWSSSFHSEDPTFYPVTMIMMRDDLHINGASELRKSEAGVSVWDVKSKL